MPEQQDAPIAQAVGASHFPFLESRYPRGVQHHPRFDFQNVRNLA